ncbi:MAG: c-type cytochrome [Pseudomonadota bacterium]
MMLIRRTLAVLAILLLGQPVLAADEPDFQDKVERIEEALVSNPGRALPNAIDSCRQQKAYAVKLYHMGMAARADRTLAYCFDALQISEEATVEEIAAISQEQLKANADAEYDKAMTLTPDIENGLEIYRQCAACHQGEGWGNALVGTPQIAGQHRDVVIRQLADFRSGNRDSVIMIPYATAEIIGGPQAIADVAGYIDSLQITTENGKGPGDTLDLGKTLYDDHCAECHGANGEGSNDELVPRIQAQHYRYLKRQFEWMRDGQRRNANAEMVAQIQGFEDSDISAIMDYVSRMEPPPEFQAPPGWKNPDFN